MDKTSDSHRKLLEPMKSTGFLALALSLQSSSLKHINLPYVAHM